MEIKRDRENRTLFINQKKYLENMLEIFGKTAIASRLFPLLKRPTEQKEFDKNLYQQAIGCLTCILTATRPDISTAVILLMCCLSNEHWNGVKRLLH